MRAQDAQHWKARLAEEYPRGSSTRIFSAIRKHADRPRFAKDETVKVIATSFKVRDYADHGVSERVLIENAAGEQRWVDAGKVVPPAKAKLHRVPTSAQHLAGKPERHLAAAGC